MAASVRIEDEAFNDPRIELLGSLSGYNRFEALGRLAHLWRACTQRETYIIDDIWVISCLGDKGPEALVKAGLAERVADGLRVKGTEGRIEWLKKLRTNSKKGGEARKLRGLELASQLDSQKDSQKDSQEAYPEAKTKPRPSQKATQEATQTEARRKPEASQTQALLLSIPKNKDINTLSECLPRPAENEPEPPKPAPKNENQIKAVAETRTATETTKDPSEPEKTRLRPRNPLWDAIVSVTAAEVSTNNGQIGKLVKQLNAANPPYTDSEILEFGERFHELCPWAADSNRDRPTIGELGKHIGAVRATPANVRPVAQRLGRLRTVEELAIHHSKSLFNNEQIDISLESEKPCQPRITGPGQQLPRITTQPPPS